MDLQSLLKSRVVTALLILIFVAVALITIQLYWQKRQVDTEISRLQNQSNELQGNNQELSDLIKYLNTPEYKEREAREKLNLKRPGEEVVVLPEESDNNSLVDVSSADSEPNPRKWYNYFFQNK